MFVKHPTEGAWPVVALVCGSAQHPTTRKTRGSGPKARSGLPHKYDHHYHLAFSENVKLPKLQMLKMHPDLFRIPCWPDKTHVGATFSAGHQFVIPALVI